MSKKSKKAKAANISDGQPEEALVTESLLAEPEAPVATVEAEPEKEDEAAKEEEAPQAEPEEEETGLEETPPATPEDIKGKQKADIKGALPEALGLKLNALAHSVGINPEKIVIEDFDEEETKSNPAPKQRSDFSLPDGDKQNVYKVLSRQDYDWKGASGFQIYCPESKDKDGNAIGGMRFHCYLLGKRDKNGHFEEEPKLSEKKKEEIE